jgi:hypothetical protein
MALKPNVSASNSLCIRFSSYFQQAAERIGSNLSAPLQWKELLPETGFTDVHIKWYNFPIGSWPKDPRKKIMGKVYQMNLEAAIKLTIPLLVKVMGMNEAEVTKMAEESVKEYSENELGLYSRFGFFWARKPE